MSKDLAVMSRLCFKYLLETTTDDMLTSCYSEL